MNTGVRHNADNIDESGQSINQGYQQVRVINKSGLERPEYQSFLETKLIPFRVKVGIEIITRQAPNLTIDRAITV